MRHERVKRTGMTLLKRLTSLSLQLCLCVVNSLSHGNKGSLGGIGFTCPEGTMFYDGHCYSIVSARMSWHDAVTTCERNRMFAMTWIEDAEENNWIADHAMIQHQEYWIGLSKTRNDMGNNELRWNKYRTSTDVPSMEKDGHWGNMQPDRSSGDCVSVMQEGNGWRYQNCLQRLPFICRSPAIPLQENDVFFCHNGKGINKRWTCDRQNDCGDNSDEVNCPSTDLCSYYYNSELGTLTSSSSSYRSRATCRWTIEVPIGKRIKLMINQNYNLERNADILSVWTGGYTMKESSLLGEVTGSSSSTQTFYSSNNFMILILSSDGTIENAGFTASWNTNVPEISNDVVSLMANTSWQELRSPFYPNYVPYELRSRWLIMADTKNVISIRFDDIDLPKGSILELRDGGELESPLVFSNPLTEIPNPAIYISKNRNVLVSLTTESEMDMNAKGFKLMYKEGCSLALSGLEGYVHSPGLLIGGYPDNVTCDWTITLPQAESRALSLRVTDFTLRMSDYLKIYNDSSKSTALHPDSGFTGSTSPIGHVFVSSTGHIVVEFESNLVLPDVGFKAQYSVDCPELSVSQWTINSDMDSYTAFDNVINLSCQDGYSFKQEEFNGMSYVPLKCLAGGKWNVSRIPDCQISYCGPPPTILNGVIKGDMGPYGVIVESNVTYECNGGFTMSSSDTITCQPDGMWETPPTCSAQSCQTVVSPTNGNVTITAGSGTDYATIVRFYCDPGYELDGPEYVYCKSDGSWSHMSPSCIKIRCPIPERVRHGSVVRSSTIVLFEGTAMLTCDNGYVINGTSDASKTVTCSQDGRFETMEPCVDNNECSTDPCDPLQDCVNTMGSFECPCKAGYQIDNSQCIDINECNTDNGGCSDNCMNDSPGYHCTCNNGYELYAYAGFNNISLSGEEMGMMKGDLYYINHTCVRKMCPPQAAPMNGMVLSERQLFYYNDKLDFICDQGYVLKGSRQLTCTATGDWDSNAPTCSIGTCTTPQMSSDSNINRILPGESTAVNFSDNVIIECNYGSQMINKSLYCVETGLTDFGLRGDNPSCPVIDCGDPDPVPGATYSMLNETTLGNSFQFLCNVGFQLSGVSSSGNDMVMCQENGRWSFGNLTCQGGRCTDPGTPGGAVQVVTSYEVGKLLYFDCTTDGYEVEPPGPLLCEVSSDNVTIQWNTTGSPLPLCTDKAAPRFSNCPTETIYVDATEAVQYTVPSATDNSEGVRSVSVSPANFKPGVYVNSDVDVVYTAEDFSGNNATCIVMIRIKDHNYPSVTCDRLKGEYIDTAAGRIVNISDYYTVVGSANTTVSPSDQVLIDYQTLDNPQMITVTAADRWGTSSSCSFLLYTTARSCFRETFPETVSNADVSCTANNITCTVVCRTGHVFPDGTSTQQYDCTGQNMWSPLLPPQSCVPYERPRYQIIFDIVYDTSVPASGCLASHNAALLANNNSFINDLNSRCNIPGVVEVGDIVVQETSSTALTLQLTTQFTVVINGGLNADVSAYGICASLLTNSAANGMSGLLSYSTNINCGGSSTGVTKRSTTLVNNGNLCSSSKEKIITSDFGEQCVSCRPGTYVLSGVCTACPDGKYQDVAGQTTCKTCPSGQVPNDNKTACRAICPEGFRSLNGVTACTPCGIDEYSVNTTHCASCPVNTSTLNINAVSDVSGCNAHCASCPVNTLNTAHCVSCPVNTVNTTHCASCPVNTSTLNIDAVSDVSGCKAQCQRGEFSVTGYEPCTACPLHHYQEETGQTMCMECPTNAITTGTGKTNSSDCMDMSAVFCNSSVTQCNGEGACDVQYHEAFCTCNSNSNYTGDSCDELINPCDSNPCFNGGTCTRVDSMTYTCQCPVDSSCRMISQSGVAAGILDYEAVDRPNSDVCRQDCINDNRCLAMTYDGGYCFKYDSTATITAANKDYAVKVCRDDQLFIGMQCETDNIDSCNTTGNAECAPYGMCQDMLGDNYNCLCPTVGEYTGDKCEKDEDLCSPDPCHNDGTCVSFGSVRYQCLCKPGFTGQKCQTNLNECTMNPDGCFYNSSCNDMENKYTCTCLYGFSGDHCEKTVDLCNADGCPNGICYSDYTSYRTVCICEPPYELDNMGKCTLMDPCGGVDCINGSCSNGVCSCIAGFTGSRCQHNIDECDSMPCGSNGRCVDMVNSYECQCNSGFTGTNCETNMDDCPGSCDPTNTNRTEDRVNNCQCICKGGYTGVNCTETIDECMSYPCQHGGTCIDGDNDYTCNCTEGWEGKNCQSIKNYCADSPCSNSGDCYNLYDGRFCRCRGGTRGETCDDAPPLCNVVQPCVNSGACWDTEGTTKCNCTINYTGQSCQLIKDHCTPSSNPCKSTGTCVTEDVGYTCSCNSGYSGPDCGTSADLCSSVSCPSGTTCAQTSEAETVCYCNQGRVRTDSGCKVPDTNYDILFDMMLGDKGASLRQPIIHTGSDLTIALWVKAVKDSGTSETSVFQLKTGEPEVEIFNINMTHLIIRDSTPGAMTMAAVSLDTDLNDGDWHHITILWRNSSSLTLVVDAVKVQDDFAVMMINASLSKVSSIDVGEHFSGRISQVVVWDMILSITDVYKLFGDRSFTPSAQPLQAWTNYRIEKGGRLSYPSTAKNNTICDSPVCFTGKNKLKLESCGDDVYRYGNERIISVNNRNQATFSGQTTVNSSLPEGDSYTYGSYPEVMVARDTYGNFEVCRFKVYIKYNNICPTPETDGTITPCPGSSDSVCGLSCPVNSALSRPFPIIKPCTKLGVYDVTMPWNKIQRLPNCGEKELLKIKITQTMMYKLAISCDSSFYDNFINDVGDTFTRTKSNPDWGLCDVTCSNVKITPICPAVGGTLIQITVEITNINNILTVSGVNYKPREVMRILTFENNIFSYNDIAGAQLQTNSVTIEESPSCPDGFVIVGDDCVKCGKGSYLDQSSMTCELCPLGTYQATAGSTSCTNCTSEKTTLYMGSTAISDCVESCIPGYKYDYVPMSCQPCDRHEYQDMPNKDYCIPCPVGKKTSETASNSSTLCYDDCPEGTELKATGQCVDCPKGTYRNFKEDLCQSCNSSYTTDGTGKKSESDCNIIICYNGTYRNTSDSTQCYSCPVGEYQDENEQTSCKSCGTSYSTETEGANNMSLCLFYCEPGEEEDPNNPATCRKCPRGKYKDASMQFVMCSMCPTGNTTNSTGASSIEECDIEICSPGEVIGANGGCESCPLDTYQPMDIPHLNTKCLACDQGTATNQTGMANKTGCMPFCGAGQQYNGAVCEDCPMGTYKEGGEDFKFEQCLMCPENYTTKGTGKTNDTECDLLDCPPGSRINGMDCQLCPKGTYQPNPQQTSCKQCDPKRSTAGEGSVNETACQIDCPAGEEERDASNNCTKCHENYIKPNSGSGLCQACTGNYTANNNRTECDVILCDKGYIADNATHPSMCVPCAVGTYKVARGNADSCVKCEAGFTTVSEASTMDTQCDQPYCVPGKFELGGVCIDCPLGFYKSMEGNDNCTMCPSNATTSMTGSSSPNDCNIVVCEVGEKRIESTNTCEKCSIGEYSPERARDSCIPCGSDKTTESTGSDMLSDCVDICAAGQQFNSATKGCDVCPLGYYKETSDITTTCTKCQTGKTTPNTGSTSSTDCSLDDCTAGYYRASGGCMACPVGQYQDQNSQTSCKLCAADQTTENNASISMDACFKNCSNGQELNRTANTCQDCGVGFYKDMTISQFCLKCPSDFTNTASRSSSCPIRIQPATTTAPVVPRRYTLRIKCRFRLNLNCDDASARASAVIEIKRVVILRFTTLHIKYAFCLVSDCFSRITIRMRSCGGNVYSRRKRAIEDTELDVEIPDVSETTVDNDRPVVIQSTDRVITEDMVTNPTEYSNQGAQYTFDGVVSSESIPECSDGSVLVNGACQPCRAGTYHNTDQNVCTPCPLHQYQDVEGQTSCKTCPTSVTKYTLQEGSNSSSQCVSDCVTNTDFCNGRGDCREDGISVYCVCTNRWSGARCTVFNEVTSNTSYIVGGTVGGISFLLLVILIVVAFCSYIRKNKKSAKYKQRLAEEYDGSMYGGPIPVLEQKPLPGRKAYMKAYNGSSMNRAFQQDEYDNYVPAGIHQSSIYMPGKPEDESSEFMWHVA